jgi:hypothetical protein
MHILRALNIALVLFFSAHVSGNYKSLSVETSTSSYRAEATASTIEERLRNNIKETTISVNELRIKKNWKTTIQLSLNTANYSQYKIYDFIGTESQLGDNLAEQSVAVDNLIYLPESVVQIGLSSNFGSTPIRRDTLRATYLKTVSEAFKWGVDFGLQKQQVPENYFTNPFTGDRERRPEILDTYSLGVSIDSALSSTYKNRLEFVLAHRAQDRPIRYGIVFKNLLVLTDTSSMRADLGYLSENTDSKLRTDVGYQTSYWSEIKYINLLTTYWTVGFGYGLEVNRENKTWLKVTDQLGNDQFHLEARYEQSNYAAHFSIASAKYNTGQTGTNFKGGLEWFY